MIKAAARPFPRLSVFYRCHSTTGTTNANNKSAKINATTNHDKLYHDSESSTVSRIRWFYATDVPVRKPYPLNWTASSAAAKFTPFSPYDSHRLETEYQRTIKKLSATNTDDALISKVPVLEDQLFEVDLRERALAPVYWEGPVFEVRRGTWFIADGNKPVVPCPEHLAEEIEGFREKKLRSCGVDTDLTYNDHETQTTPQLITEDNKEQRRNQLHKLETRVNKDSIVKRFLSAKEKDRLKYALEENETKDDTDDSEQNYVRLENKGNTAWIVSNDFVSKILGTSNDIASTMLRKLSIGGTKLVRGYREINQEPDKPELAAARDKTAELQTKNPKKAESDLVSKETRPLQRDVDHLVLCVHGIGQRLGQRIESINFAHDINIFRKLLKEVFVQNEGMQEKLRAHIMASQPSKLERACMEEYFESEEGAYDSTTNHRVQVIPLIWRHDISFGMTRDDIEQQEDESQQSSKVSLEDITVEGITPLRGFIGDVVLDVLLFYQPQYHAQIIESNVKLLNSTFRKFCEQNPRFAKNPKVSLIGHSLGSAIVFDILCGQNSKTGLQTVNTNQVPQLDFEVDNFFGVGSPVGMFQLLKGNHLEGRHYSNNSNGVFNSVTPQVNNYYNVFHPSDPVAYRVDPLAHCDAALLPPKLVPFAEGSFPSQIQALQQLSQRFASEASNMWNMAASMLPQTSKFSDLLKAAERDASRPTSQNAVQSKPDGAEGKPNGAESKRSEDKKKFSDLPAEVQEEARRRLRLLNPKAEQVDHSFQVGPLDITLVSALASHVSYFENADLANFVLQCIYSRADKAEKK